MARTRPQFIFVPLISFIVDAGMEIFGGARNDVIDGGMTLSLAIVTV